MYYSNNDKFNKQRNKSKAIKSDILIGVYLLSGFVAFSGLIYYLTEVIKVVK